MDQVNDRYRHRAAQFTSKLEAVPGDAWDNQSPCPEWTTRGVVQHVVDSSNHFLSWVDRAIDPPSAEKNPMAAWKATRDAVQNALDDQSIAGKVLERPMGTGTFAEFADNYLVFDLVVHAWDLSRAAGIDDTLDPSTVIDARSHAETLVETGRKMGAFGPEVIDTTTDDEQTRLLAMVGRRR